MNRRLGVGTEEVQLFEGFVLPRSPLLKALAKALDIQQKRRSNPDRSDPLPPAAVVALWRQWQNGQLAPRLQRVTVPYLAGLGLGLRADKRGVELVRLQLDDVTEAAGNQLAVSFRDIKNMPAGMLIPIEPAEGDIFCPCTLLRLQKQMRVERGASATDPLFVTVTGKRTSAGYWSTAVRAAVRSAVESGVMTGNGKWSSRSLRVGGVTALQRLGFGKLDARALGGWNSNAMHYYLRRQSLADSKLSTQMFSLQN